MALNTGFYRKFKGYDILGWTTDGQVKWYRDLVRNISDGVIVEVGVYGGHTLLEVAQVCKMNNNKMYGIDPWELLKNPNGETWDDEKLQELRDVLKEVKDKLIVILDEIDYNHVELIQGFSPNEASRFEDNSIDLLFIDGSHCFDSVVADLNGFLPKIKASGVICGDDFVWPEVARGIKHFAKENGFKVKSGNGVDFPPRCWKLVK